MRLAYAYSYVLVLLNEGQHARRKQPIKMKTYAVTENNADTLITASSQQEAMNKYFNVERAVKKMQPKGHWSDRRGSCRSATIRRQEGNMHLATPEQISNVM